MLQLLLPKRATKQRVAVLIHPIGEVLTGHADAGSFPALKLCVVDKGPFLHAPPDWYRCISTVLGMESTVLNAHGNAHDGVFSAFRNQAGTGVLAV